MTYQYDLHGVPLSVQAEGERGTATVEELFEYFPSGGDASVPPLHISVRSTFDQLPDAPLAAPVCQGAAGDRTWAMYQGADGQTVRFHGTGIVRMPAGADRAALDLCEGADPEDALFCLHFALVELMKRRGMYTIHAATLERGGHGALITGASGRGKTTTCLSLIRAGYHCVADDHPFLQERDGAIRAHAFPEPIQATDNTRAMIPELAVPSAPLTPGPRKWSFRLEEVFGNAWAGTCVPRVVLFPQVIPWPTSYVEPMSPARVMEELLPNGFRVLDREIATRHFHLLADLARQVRGYRLFLGEDVLSLPDVVNPLLPA